MNEKMEEAGAERRSQGGQAGLDFQQLRATASAKGASMLHKWGEVLDKVKDKAAELREEVVARTQSNGQQAAVQLQQQQQQQQQLPQAQEGLLTDSRAQSIHLCGQDIEGVSIAGQETSIILPRAKVVFDIGRCPQRAVFQQNVFLSHGHLDHIGGIPFHASSRALLDLPPPRYFVLPHYVDKLKQLLELSAAIQGGPAFQYDVVPLETGQEYSLPTGHIVRPFATTHTIPSQGYILYSYRKKLKAELVGKSQQEIKELRQSGVEVTETYQIPEVAFTGDTSGALLEEDSCPDIFRAKLLVVELSFVDDSSVTWEQARERGHMHITDLVMHAHKFHNEAILLIHFSSRYKREEILAALDANMPANLRSKCVPFLNGFP